MEEKYRDLFMKDSKSSNSIKSTFDDMRYDEDRIVIPLYHNQKLLECREDP